jgi:hypothetical protein
MGQIAGVIYWLGYFIALGFCCADLVFSRDIVVVKIFRFVFLPLLSWVYVGFFMGTSLNEAAAQRREILRQLVTEKSGLGDEGTD